MSFAIPVVVLAFNRPKQTELLLSEIARVRPRTLLVVADGPRAERPQDQQMVDQTRALFDRVSWPCEVLRNFSDENLGCKNRVSSGLDWVFQQCEQAIILEDDCLPAPSFFEFCRVLLERYQHDERVMSIAGANFQDGRARGEQSYYYSKFFLCWGWASWRRAWQHFDVDMQSWPEFKARGGMRWFADSDLEERFWTRIFDAEHAGQIDSWAYAFSYACFQQGGLHAIPNVNLVSNIGFDESATHTNQQGHDLANLPRGDLQEIRHPPFVIAHKDADAFMFQNAYRGNRKRGLKKLYASIRKRLPGARHRRAA